MNTKKLKTAELTDTALDWAVAKCEGKNGVLHDDGMTRCIVIAAASGVYKGTYRPSINWSQGGPIVEREIDKYQRIPDTKSGFVFIAGTYSGHMGAGPTLLIATMRCYVASKLGDDVEVPDQLTS